MELNEKARQIEAEIGKTIFDQIQRQVKAEIDRVTAGIVTASAWIDYYLLIAFGHSPNEPYETNSIQFYSNTSGPLC